MIERRILVNFRVDPEVLARVVPAPFRPQLIDGHGLAGICLIRLSGIRPLGLPGNWGIASENAAHRIAVEWTRGDELRTGVYVLRRDTSSWLNALAGNRVFPGAHHWSQFQIAERGDEYRVQVDHPPDGMHVLVVGRQATAWPATSVFPSWQKAASFFETGAVGYSPARRQGEFDGLELRCFRSNAAPLTIERVESSFFDDPQIFPPGSTELDGALLMRGIEHQWHAQEPLRSAEPIRSPGLAGVS